MTKRRGLGRGLGALIPTDTSAETAAAQGLKLLDPAQIDPNPHQPRSDFAEEQLQELAASIKEHGLIQPLIVTAAADGRYTLIAGERRWRAAKLVGLERLPVVVKEATPQEMLELAIIENVQRADLNPLEEAIAYQQLKEEFGLTQQEVADRVGKARPTVANIMRLVNLPEAAKKALLDGQITQRHGRAILDAKLEEEEKLVVLKSVVSHNLNVAQTVDLIRKLENKRKPTPKPTKQLAPEIVALQDNFRQRLGTRVDVQKSGKGGKVVIHFYSDEELNNIYDVIVGEEGEV